MGFRADVPWWAGIGGTVREGTLAALGKLRAIASLLGFIWFAHIGVEEPQAERIAEDEHA